MATSLITRLKEDVVTGALMTLSLVLGALPVTAQPAMLLNPGSAGGCGHAAPEAKAVERAARTYAAFWDSGDEALARAALALAFKDHTLPRGRPQGVEGVLAASRSFRAAVRDLRAEVLGLIVAGEYAVVRYHFSGHFTGSFGERVGMGQPVSFIAIDIYRIADDRIAEDWHLEDNLTLLRQLGVVPE